MENLLLYSLKVHIVLIILFGCYWLLLKNTTFFKLNRIYLLAVILLSFILPLGPSFDQLGWNNGNVNNISQHINNALQTEEKVATPTNDKVQEASSRQTIFGLPDTLLYVIMTLYFFVCLILFSRLILQLSKLRRIITKNKPNYNSGLKIFNVSENISPFSFMDFIVANRSHFSPQEWQQVVLHEKVHINQWHSLDVILSEIAYILLWVNPVSSFIKMHIKLNLEYLADDEVMAAGVNKKQYQYGILQACLFENNYPVANLFNSSKIKQRIKMMNSNTTPKVNIWKYVLTIPMLFAVYLIIHPSNAQTVVNANAQSASSKSTKGIASKNEQGIEDIYIVIYPDAEKKLLNAIKSRIEKLNGKFNLSDLEYKNGIITDINLNVVFPNGGSVSFNESSKPLTSPIYLYYHGKTDYQGVSFGTTPAYDKLSKRARLVMEDNLKGMLVLYKNGNTMLSGEVHTKW